MYTQGHLGMQLTQEINPFIAISMAIEVVFCHLVPRTVPVEVRRPQSMLDMFDDWKAMRNRLDAASIREKMCDLS